MATSWRGRWDVIALAVLVIGVFWLRMSLATGVDTLSFDSYLTVRNVESILEDGHPIREDPLSVMGHQRIGSPVFQYLLAVGVAFSPLAYKILPNLLMALAIIPVFFLARRITGSPWTGIVAALLAGSGPFVLAHGLVTPASSTLAILLLLTVLAMLHDPDEHLVWLLILAILLTFVHPLAFVLVISLLIIIALLRLEGFGVDRRIVELFIFTGLLVFWFTVITYKQALLSEGVRILWRNLPAESAQAIFGDVTFSTLLYGLGVLTFLFGVLGAYHVLFEDRVKEAYAVIGASIAVVAGLLLRLLPFDLGLAILTLTLAVMAGHGMIVSARYIRRTRAPWMIYPLAAIAFALFLLTATLPALGSAQAALRETPSASDLEGYAAVGAALPDGAILLTTVREGAAVQYAARATVIADQDFLLVSDADMLVADIGAVYSARFTSPILARAQRLGFTHILFSPDAASQFGRKELLITGSRCITRSDPAPGMILYAITCGGGEDG